MTYAETLALIKRYSAEHPLVGTVREGSPEGIDYSSDIQYGLVVISPEPHSLTASLNTYNFNIFFIGRLQSDLGDEVSLHSTAIRTLKEIVGRLGDLFEIDIETPYPAEVFAGSYSELTGGAHITVSITAADQAGVCYPAISEIFTLFGDKTLNIYTASNQQIYGQWDQ